MTIQPGAKLPIDMRGLLASLGADAAGTFAQGSVSVYFEGTIMPLVGQMTIENPTRHWVQQAEMVENDPGRSDIPAVLSGQWWGLAGGRDATIIVPVNFTLPCANQSPVGSFYDGLVDDWVPDDL